MMPSEIAGWAIAVIVVGVVVLAVSLSSCHKESTVHTHPTHNYSILYTASEHYDVVESGIPSIVVDVCGCVYQLSPDSRNYMDYEQLYP